MARHKKYPCNYHKWSENETILTINYLTNKWNFFKQHRFLGFIKTYEDAVESLKLDGVNYIACHLFFCDTPYLIGRNKDEDTAEIAKKKPFILMSAGGDDLSYAKRFGTKTKALTVFENLEIFIQDFERQCWVYN